MASPHDPKQPPREARLVLTSDMSEEEQEAAIKAWYAEVESTEAGRAALSRVYSIVAEWFLQYVTEKGLWPPPDEPDSGSGPPQLDDAP